MKLNPLTQAIAATALVCAALEGIAADGVHVLGVGIGRADVPALERAARGAGARETSRDTSAITGGPMLAYTGDFGLPGLHKTIFLFWPDGPLAAASLDLDKGRYDQVLAALKQKYTLVTEHRPLVGNRSAVLRAGDVEIRVTAPHLSFSMQVVYAQKRFWSQLAEFEKKQDADRRRQQEARL